jgi:hypothetical protein
MTEPDKLPDDIAELKAIIRAQQDQNARLEALVAQNRARVSAKSPTGEALKYIAKYWDGEYPRLCV